MARQQMKGAFPGCTWCYGSGCMMCDEERRKYEERLMEPIFVADQNDPADMEALKRVFSADALQKAFGPDGGGMQEVEYNAAVESLVQAIRKSGVFKTEEQGETDEVD
jgi:hypothetical protein